MSKENLTMFEQVIDSEKGEEREFYLKGLKDMIGKLEKDADEDLKKEIDRLKSKFSIGGAKKSPAKKPTAKRTAKPKTTKEEREQKKAEVKDATGKTIEECKEILAKYEAMRLKTNKEQKERVSELKKKDEIIDGTNVKTADATTKTTAKEVAPKIKKEVEQIEKEAEREAKKVVKPQGKTATEVKKQVEKKKEEIIEKKVEDMTEDLISATTKFIESVSDEIGKFKKDDQKKFLINLRKEIDVLLRDYGYGGELGAGVQAYEVPWMGGKPSMYAKGGEVNSDIVKAIFEPNEFNGKIETTMGNKTLKGLERMIAENDAYDVYRALRPNFEGRGDGLIATEYGDKNMKGLIAMIENAKGVYAKGGDVPRFSLSDEILNSMSSSEYDDLYVKALRFNVRRWQMGLERFSLPESMYLVYYDQNFPKGSKEREEYIELYKKYVLGNHYAKGGKTRSLRSIRTDRARLSQEPWEQAYLPNRKGNYYAKGGEVGDYEVGDIVRIGDTYNENYDDYRGKDLRIIHKATNETEHKLFDSSLQGYGLYDMEVVESGENVPFSLYDYELELSSQQYSKGGEVRENDLYYIDWTNKKPRLADLKDEYGLESISFSFDKDPVVIDAINNNHIWDIAVIKGNMGYDAFKYNPEIFNPLDFGGVSMKSRGNYYAKGGNVENSFSRKAEARGLDTEDFMNQVLHNPSYYDERTRRQAQFMKNEFNM